MRWIRFAVEVVLVFLASAFVFSAPYGARIEDHIIESRMNDVILDDGTVITYGQILWDSFTSSLIFAIPTTVIIASLLFWYHRSRL